MSRICDVNYDKIIENMVFKIRDNQDLCKLIYYNNSNPLDMPDIEDTTMLSLDTEEHKKCIYRSPFVPLETDKQTILDIFITETEPCGSQSYEDIYVSIFVMSHIDLWELDNGNRLNKIMSKLNKLFLYSDGLETVSNSISERKKFLSWSEKYKGYALVYKATDFS